ncbi:hypothetical protein RIF29_00831 [Crotalaria pallida]|uniref:Uncharacterized protein n=1 Tax=Crotalaria pallida TaxID=3830 RepID=A0AAN9IW37_CROPI
MLFEQDRFKSKTPPTSDSKCIKEAGHGDGAVRSWASMAVIEPSQGWRSQDSGSSIRDLMSLSLAVVNVALDLSPSLVRQVRGVDGVGCGKC